MIFEGKKSAAGGACLQRDKQKLFHLQKLVLDLQLINGVRSPMHWESWLKYVSSSEGMLEFFVLSLEHEALYVVKELGNFPYPINSRTFKNIETDINIMMEKIFEQIKRDILEHVRGSLRVECETSIMEREGEILPESHKEYQHLFWATYDFDKINILVSI
ncbi:hypothetical protein BCR41DRAFT_369903 [Lobosporangium transversale]|uniref:Uncharacterized protein n=1 Tax=Lobosporangium transversale TaxID=64571 RepID=A0A1Y2GQH9_9FUNG|nr:hypothetical protein BCR41DRAFT_369903 [Lobosporangium transversale]ORZ19148.1 hypothetical protein BCR41DRAFT_369903 [Lobosporangium transversale]|eukprot:XP_021882316.1 hypothetical protein BCR41DRAFT_369903 [Lobosporangium transversale]